MKAEIAEWHKGRFKQKGVLGCCGRRMTAEEK